MAKGSLFHWGPLVALSIIFTLFIGSIYSSLVWWPPNDTTSGVINIGLLVVFLVCILFNFIKAAWVGPGYVPHQWKPVRSTRYNTRVTPNYYNFGVVINNC